ncbi:hypothetical protein HK097_005955, partial [Rhizophlyctis rosea]
MDEREGEEIGMGDREEQAEEWKRVEERWRFDCSDEEVEDEDVEMEDTIGCLAFRTHSFAPSHQNSDYRRFENHPSHQQQLDIKATPLSQRPPITPTPAPQVIRIGQIPSSTSSHLPAAHLSKKRQQQKLNAQQQLPPDVLVQQQQQQSQPNMVRGPGIGMTAAQAASLINGGVAGMPGGRQGRGGTPVDQRGLQIKKMLSLSAQNAVAEQARLGGVQVPVGVMHGSPPPPNVNHLGVNGVGGGGSPGGQTGQVGGQQPQQSQQQQQQRQLTRPLPQNGTNAAPATPPPLTNGVNGVVVSNGASAPVTNLNPQTAQQIRKVLNVPQGQVLTSGHVGAYRAVVMQQQAQMGLMAGSGGGLPQQGQQQSPSAGGGGQNGAGAVVQGQQQGGGGGGQQQQQQQQGSVPVSGAAVYASTAGGGLGLQLAPSSIPLPSSLPLTTSLPQQTVPTTPQPLQPTAVTLPTSSQAPLSLQQNTPLPQTQIQLTPHQISQHQQAQAQAQAAQAQAQIQNLATLYGYG